MGEIDFGKFMQIEIDTANRIYKTPDLEEEKKKFLRERLRHTHEERVAYMKKLNPSILKILWDDFLLVSYYIGSKVRDPESDPNIIEGLNAVNDANCHFQNGLTFWSNAVPLALKGAIILGTLTAVSQVGL